MKKTEKASLVMAPMVLALVLSGVIPVHSTTFSYLLGPNSQHELKPASSKFTEDNKKIAQMELEEIRGAVRGGGAVETEWA